MHSQSFKVKINQHRLYSTCTILYCWLISINFLEMSSSIITKPLSEKIYAVRTRLGICSFAHPSFAQIAQDRWANVTNSLRSLRTNEQLWGNRSGHSWKMSKCEQFAQVAQEKWANEQITRFFEQSLNFLFCSQKISDLLKKNWKTCIFCMFLQFFKK